MSDTSEVLPDYREAFNDAARQACTAYLDGLGACGPARRAQEYDQLTPAGQTVWRAVVTKGHRRLLEAEVRHCEACATTDSIGWCPGATERP